MFNTGSGGQINDSSVTRLGQRVYAYFRSPRIAGAHVDLLRWIHLGQGNRRGLSFWEEYGSFTKTGNTSDRLVVWAAKDREYRFPSGLQAGYKKVEVPYNHYFPVLEYEHTAEILAAWAGESG
jgi:hypothetical protein